jgi:excisionase family DNA binding protein
MEKKFYTKKETAEILGVHPKTVERYLLAGKLKGARLGKSWKISADDIQLFYDTVKKETEKAIKDKERRKQ